MNKKFLLILLLCCSIILTGCSRKSTIDVNIKVNSYANAKEFAVYNQYNSNNALYKYYQQYNESKEQTQNENAEAVRNIRINDKSFEFNYAEMKWLFPHYKADAYTLNSDENIKVYYYKDTDIVRLFLATEDASLETLFPNTNYSFDSEEGLKAYCESVADLCGVDISDLTYKVRTRVLKNNDRVWIDGYDVVSSNEVVRERVISWEKEYENEYSISAITFTFDYDEGDVLLSSVHFLPCF